MNITTSGTPLASVEGLLAVAVREGHLAEDLGAIEAEFGKALVQATSDDDFKGKAGSWRSYPTFGNIAADRLVLVGMGEGTSEDAVRAAGKVGDIARRFGIASLSLYLGALQPEQLDLAITALHEGNYRFDKYKGEEDRKAPLEAVTLLGLSQVDSAHARAVAVGLNFARDLVNEPAGIIYPETLAEAARGLGDDQITVTVWEEDRIKSEGMGGITAVGQGSVRPPRFVHMHYKPQGTSRRKVCLVGKGVTFDSGGLSLKPSSGMQTMRCDMGGSAVVLGAMRAIKELRPDVEVHGIFGAVENMPSGNSYKLGDVLKMYNGKTVEIHNTDAEGRLVLADCLSYADALGVDAIIDLATLTGAVLIALGDEFSGLFTADDALASDIEAAAKATCEGLWRLPLADTYRDLLKAEWGTVKNVGGRAAGSITAALFLSEFVDKTPWAHIDIAGPTFIDKSRRHLAAGATGAMVRTMVAWATR